MSSETKRTPITKYTLTMNFYTSALFEYRPVSDNVCDPFHLYLIEVIHNDETGTHRKR
jgi:hypothetical protein